MLMLELSAAGVFAPTVARDVHEHAHEPRFFRTCAGRNRVRMGGRAKKRLLNEVPGLVHVSGHTPGQPVETLMVLVEECRQTQVVRLPRTDRGGGRRQSDRVAHHAEIDART